MKYKFTYKQINIMFILRKINSSGIQLNVCLNKSYNLILESNEEEFARTAKLNFNCIEELSNIYAFIIYNDGADIMPLSINHQNYIMTDSGSTFANITFKK